MPDFGASNLIIFFTAATISLFFVIAWIIKSEVKINFCKKEIAKLRARLDSSEREKFAIAEKLSAIEIASGGAIPDDMIKRYEDLEKENIKIRAELSEAKGSLEEVYKAIVSQG